MWPNDKLPHPWCENTVSHHGVDLEPPKRDSAEQRKRKMTALNREREEEENQDHEFILCFDIFLHFNIIFQYYE